MKKLLLIPVIIFFSSCSPEKDVALTIIRSKTPECFKIIRIGNIPWKAADYYISSDSSGNIYKWMVMFDGRTSLIKE